MHCQVVDATFLKRPLLCRVRFSCYGVWDTWQSPTVVTHIYWYPFLATKFNKRLFLAVRFIISSSDPQVRHHNRHGHRPCCQSHLEIFHWKFLCWMSRSIRCHATFYVVVVTTSWLLAWVNRAVWSEQFKVYVMVYRRASARVRGIIYNTISKLL